MRVEEGFSSVGMDFRVGRFKGLEIRRYGRVGDDSFSESQIRNMISGFSDGRSMCSYGRENQEIWTIRDFGWTKFSYFGAEE